MPESVLPKAISDAIVALNRLPGIGPKSAQRLAYHLLRSPQASIENLSQSLLRLKTDVLLCESCFNFADQQPCLLCQSQERDKTQICVVEEPFHLPVIERIGGYYGLYHVLHGGCIAHGGYRSRRHQMQGTSTATASGQRRSCQGSNSGYQPDPQRTGDGGMDSPHVGRYGCGGFPAGSRSLVRQRFGIHRRHDFPPRHGRPAQDVISGPPA